MRDSAAARDPGDQILFHFADFSRFGLEINQKFLGAAFLTAFVANAALPFPGRIFRANQADEFLIQLLRIHQLACVHLGAAH